MTFEEFLSEWPNCATPDCAFKVCDWAHPSLCYRCAEQVLGPALMEKLYALTHDHDPRCDCDVAECLCAASVERSGVICGECRAGDHYFDMRPQIRATS